MMGLAKDAEQAGRNLQAIPKIVLVAPPMDAGTLSGETVPAESVDLTLRMVSMERVHRSVALTGAMCTAVASKIPRSLVSEVAGALDRESVRIGQPSGVVELAVKVRAAPGGIVADSVVVHRTQRRIMDGHVLIPNSRYRAGPSLVKAQGDRARGQVTI
jgi:2-methylaconitate isomerase